MWDVIVVGAGPGGSLTAKKCAENGFRTLLLERKKLPRDKVCSGMIAGSWAQDIIKEEFGEIPQETLVSPFHLLGQMFHVPGAEPRSLAWHTLIGWRKDLDAWMNRKAREAGAEIWDGAGVVAVEQSERRCIMKANRSGQRLSLDAKYVVAADGAGSVVRKSIFPELKVRYSLPVRECYETPLNLEPQFFHWFFPKARPRPRFDITFKGNAFLVEGSGIKELRPEITDILHAKGCDPSLKPLWKDACRIPLLHRDLIDGNFLPASDNVLLTGDAAGLLLPISFEGIGTALKSGQAAADSILEGSRLGRDAGGIYLRALRPMIDEIERLSELEKSLAQQADAGPEYFCEALKKAYEETLRGQV